MITALVTFVRSLLFDPAAAQRYLVAGLYLIGEFITSGGVVPGTTMVIGVDVGDWSRFGALAKAAAFYFGAGGAFSGPMAAVRKNGNGGVVPPIHPPMTPP